MKHRAVLIVVENLPVPLDRRVWQEACALRDAGYEVIVICPKMRGFTAAQEKIDGIQIYRHWISEEAGGFIGFFREYASALWGELRLAWKAWRRHRFQVIHLCNPPDLLFLMALPRFVLLLLLFTPQVNRWFFGFVLWFFDASGVPRQLIGWGMDLTRFWSTWF